MVRGDQRCPNFCKNCKSDCVCETAGCKRCHSCRDTDFRKSRMMDLDNVSRPAILRASSVPICESYEHDCNLKVDLELNGQRFVERLFEFPKLFGTEIVEIAIGTGSDKQTRRVPKGALIEHSYYFKGYFSFNDKSNNATTEPLTLDTDVDRIDAFDMFIQYIYWQDYQASKPRTDSAVKLIESDLRPHARVYVLAERLQVPGLKMLAVKKATLIGRNISKALWMHKLSSDMNKALIFMLEAVRCTYRHTPDLGASPLKAKSEEAEGQSNAKKSDDSGVSAAGHAGKDHFRVLLCLLGASCLENLKELPNSKFADCVREFPEFGVDVLLNINDLEGTYVDMDNNGFPFQVQP